jgi:NAD(P)H-dependent flavin oxidoreductase YrpB (nitropropane dioxygenase family)
LAPVVTPVCQLLGIAHPIVQAPIGNAAVPQLAAAVSNAGALGTVALTWADDVASTVRQTSALTRHPFGGNLVLAWDQHRRLGEALEAGLRIVSLTWGDPSSYVERAHDADALVLHTVGSAEEARRAVAAGVDVIVAQGWEAGGHVWGSIATLPLVPAVVDAVAPVPVIAAGGIGDARGVAAVLALGAQAAWLGTRFLLAQETPVHPAYKRHILSASETDAVWYRDLYDIEWPNAPHRALRNSTASEWEAAGCPPPGERPGEGEAIAQRVAGETIVRYSSAMPLIGSTGDIEALSLWGGQSVALARQVQTAAEIVAELVARPSARAATKGGF